MKRAAAARGALPAGHRLALPEPGEPARLRAGGHAPLVALLLTLVTLWGAGVPAARADGWRYLCAHAPTPAALPPAQCHSLLSWPLPPHPRLLDGSAAASHAMISRLMSMGYGGARSISLNPPPGEDWGVAIYQADPAAPAYRIHCTGGAGACPVEGALIHLPEQARPADGGDAGMSVIDREAGYEYDFYDVQSVPLPPGGGTLEVH